MKIEIKSIYGTLLFEGDFSCIANAVKAAIKAKADLSSADLRSADLSSADLSSANLSYSDLSSANLRYANLSFADLRYALHRYSQIAFTGHGECGRILTAIQLKKDGPISFFCGCFNGTEKQLRKYIEDGAAHLRKTRFLALETSLALIAAENGTTQTEGK